MVVVNRKSSVVGLVAKLANIVLQSKHFFVLVVSDTVLLYIFDIASFGNARLAVRHFLRKVRDGLDFSATFALSLARRLEHFFVLCNIPRLVVQAGTLLAVPRHSLLSSPRLVKAFEWQGLFAS